MELKEAIEILKNNHNPIVAERCQKCEQQDACLDENKYFLAIETVLQALEQSDADKATSYIEGITFEREHWEDKIKEKIEEIKENYEEGYAIANQGKLEVLDELLKGE